MNSLTNDFAALLHSRIDPAYSSDGPLLLHTMCTHIHRNHIAFVESVKGKIRLATLVEYKDDVPEFLRFLQDNLRLITSAGHDDEAHNDLIPHILLQLRNTKIPIFQQTILKWHRQYMENKLKLTSNKLVTMADEECQILKHFHQWVETIDPSIVAMQALIQSTSGQSNDILKSLAANLSTFTQKGRDHYQQQHQNRYGDSRRNSTNTPDWVYTPPQDLTQPRTFNGRHWYFCTKCGRNGRWVCTHRDDTHQSPPSRNHFTDTSRTDRGNYYSDRYHGARDRYYHDDSRYSPKLPLRDRYNSPNRDPRDYRDRSRSPPYNRDYHRYRAQSPSHERASYRGRSRTPPIDRSRSPVASRNRQVSFRPPTPTQQHYGKLSLFDSINAFVAEGDRSDS
jgi:hypothetical protein